MANAQLVAFVGPPGGGSHSYQIKYGGVVYPNSTASTNDARAGRTPNFVDDFGIDPSGATDDTTKINNALASVAGASRSHYISIPNYCTLNCNYMTLQPNVKIIGEGRFSQITFNGSPSRTVGRIDANGVDNWGIHNVFIDGGNTTPIGVDHSNVGGPIDPYLLDGVTNGLATGSSIRITGCKNWDITGAWFNHTLGYAVLVDATSASSYRGRIQHCRITNSRSHLFGDTGVGLGLAYGGWTGGIHVEGDGNLYNMEDLLVELCQFYQVSGHCFWTHSGAINKLHRDIRFIHNTAVDHALDMCEMAVVDGFKVIGNRSRRGGYYSATDDTFGVPRWGTVAPAVIDHSRTCINGTITDNRIECVNGVAIDGDGLGYSVIKGNIGNSAWVSADEHAQVASCGPCTSPASFNIAVGFNLGNTYSDPLCATNNIIEGNQFNGFGAGAIRLYTGRNNKVIGNTGNHPAYKDLLGSPPNQNPADCPISLGPKGSAAEQRCYDNEISQNKYNWQPPAGGPMVVEDPQYSAFLSTEKNYIHDNLITPVTTAVYQFSKSFTSGTTTGPTRLASVTTQAPAVAEYVLQSEHTLVGATDLQFKIYKNVPYGTWVGNHLYTVGQSIVDGAGYVQTCTASTGNTASSGPPTFSHTTGSSITDGGATWTCRGPQQNNLIAWFNDTTANFPSLTISGDGAISNIRDFTGHSLSIYSANRQLAIDNNGDAYFHSLSIFPAPWQAGTAYTVGQQVLDPNGYTQVATNNGTSGSGPAWNTTLRGLTNDGTGPTTIVWKNAGNQLTIDGLRNAYLNSVNLPLYSSTPVIDALGNITCASLTTGAFTVGSFSADTITSTGAAGNSFVVTTAPHPTIVDNAGAGYFSSVSIYGPSPIPGWGVVINSYGELSANGRSVITEQGGGASAPGGGNYGWTLTLSETTTTGYNYDSPHLGFVKRLSSGGDIYWKIGPGKGPTVSDFQLTRTAGFGFQDPSNNEIPLLSGDYTTGTITIGTLVPLTSGSVSTLGASPLIVKSYGAFNDTNDLTAATFCLNCTGTSQLWDMHLSPSFRAALPFNHMREAAGQFNAIAPPGASNWEIDGIIVNVASYQTPHYGGGTVAGSFSAFAAATGVYVWAQNWLIRDWIGDPSVNYAAHINGLELDMGAGNANTVVAGLAAQITWDNTFGVTVPKSIAFKVQHTGVAYFPNAIGLQDMAAKTAIHIGNSASYTSGTPISQTIDFGSFNDESSWGPVRSRISDQYGSLVFETGLDGTPANSRTVQFTADSGIYAYYFNANGYNQVIAPTGDLYGRSLTQKPPFWSGPTSYVVGQCVLDYNSNVQIALNSGTSQNAGLYGNPSWNPTIGQQTNETGSSMQWRNLGSPKLIVDQAGNGQFNYIDIHPNWIPPLPAIPMAFRINGVDCIDIYRNASFGFCGAAGFYIGGASGPSAGGVNVVSDYYMQGVSVLNCANVGSPTAPVYQRKLQNVDYAYIGTGGLFAQGVIATNSGISCYGSQTFSGYNSTKTWLDPVYAILYTASGAANAWMEITFASSFTVAYKDSHFNTVPPPPNNPPAGGPYTKLRIIGGDVVYAY